LRPFTEGLEYAIVIVAPFAFPVAVAAGLWANALLTINRIAIERLKLNMFLFITLYFFIV
jgi:hypothetical protein